MEAIVIVLSLQRLGRFGGFESSRVFITGSGGVGNSDGGGGGGNSSSSSSNGGGGGGGGKMRGCNTGAITSGQNCFYQIPNEELGRISV